MAMDLRVALYEPEIPHNTGAIARLCVASNTRLTLIGRLGFQLSNTRLKRAGLDYWQHVQLDRYEDLEPFWEAMNSRPLYYFTSYAEQLYTQVDYPANAVLVFGSETRGLPPRALAQTERCVRIPILDPRVRSLNLATAVGIGLFEAVRQNQQEWIANDATTRRQRPEPRESGG